MRTSTAFLRRQTACALLIALALSPLPTAAQDDVTLNFVNADIPSVIKAVGELTGRNFVIDPRVKGTVIITSARPVSRDQVVLVRSRGDTYVHLQEKRRELRGVKEVDPKIHRLGHK